MSLGCKRSWVRIPPARPKPLEVQEFSQERRFRPTPHYPAQRFKPISYSPAAARDGVSPATAGPLVRVFPNRQWCTRRSSKDANGRLLGKQKPKMVRASRDIPPLTKFPTATIAVA